MCLRLERQHRQIIRELVPGDHRIEAGGKRRVLCGDAGRIAAFVPVVVGAGGAAERAILIFQMRIVVAQRDQRRGADRHGVGAERQRFGDVGAIADAAGDDELHLAMQSKLLQRFAPPAESPPGSGCRHSR